MKYIFRGFGSSFGRVFGRIFAFIVIGIALLFAFKYFDIDISKYGKILGGFL